MIETEAELKPVTRSRWLTVLTRIGTFLALAFVIGVLLNQVERALERSSRPAGFGRGVLQGVLMPMAMPNLLVGKDVAIYSPNNVGVKYKLGYTAGVNSCGALFFGMLYWRLSRWRGGGKRG